MIKTSCRALLPVLLLGSVLSCTMWKKPASGWAGATGGEQLERLFWDDVKSKNWADLDRRLASSFSAAGSAGTMDREAFLKNLETSSISDVTLSNCSSQLNGGDLIVICVREFRGEAPASARQAATLSVWQQVTKGWTMIAHSETPIENKGQ